MSFVALGAVPARRNGRKAHASGLPVNTTSLQRGRALAVVVLSGVLCSCYSYVPSSTSGIENQSELRIDFTSQGATSMTGVVGPRISAVMGRVTEATDTAVTLSVTSTIKTNGVEDPWSGEKVTIPHRYIATVSKREFSGSKTVVAAALTGAAGAGIAALIGRGGGGSGGPGGTPGGR
jgi:hypothetical protein